MNKQNDYNNGLSNCPPPLLPAPDSVIDSGCTQLQYNDIMEQLSGRVLSHLLHLS